MTDRHGFGLGAFRLGVALRFSRGLYLSIIRLYLNIILQFTNEVRIVNAKARRKRITFYLYIFFGSPPPVDGSRFRLNTKSFYEYIPA